MKGGQHNFQGRTRINKELDKYQIPNRKHRQPKTGGDVAYELA